MTSPAAVRRVIERVVTDGTVEVGGRRHSIFPVAVTAIEGEALRRWVVDTGARHTVEVGLGYGVSALYLCEGLCTVGATDARHVVLDPNQATRFDGIALRLLEEAGVAEMVEHHAELSELVLPRFLAEGRRFDLAFVDGNHRFDGVFVDLVHLGRLVRPGGIVFLDDHQLPAVAKAAAFFRTNLGWTLEEVGTADELHQWAVLRTSSAPDTRDFDDFVDF